jgi:hypothetical protein
MTTISVPRSLLSCRSIGLGIITFLDTAEIVRREQVSFNFLGMANSSRNQQPCSEVFGPWRSADSWGVIATLIPGSTSLETAVSALRDYVLLFRTRPSVSGRSRQYICEFRQRCSQLAWFHTRHVRFWMPGCSLRCNRRSNCADSFPMDIVLHIPAGVERY